MHTRSYSGAVGFDQERVDTPLHRNIVQVRDVTDSESDRI